MHIFQTAKAAYVSLRELGPAQYLRYLVTAAMSRGALMDVVVRGHSVSLRAGTHDLSVAISTLCGEFDVLHDLLDPDFDGLIVDAGGFIGTAAMKLHDIFPNARIVVIEPSRRNLEVLHRNLAGLNGIDIREAALWVDAGQELELSDRGTGDWGFTVLGDAARNMPASGMHMVRTTSLDEIVEQNGFRPVGLVKLDIEGAERELFASDTGTLRSIPAVFVELHERFAPGCDSAFRTFSAGRWVIRASGEKFLSLARN